MKSNQKNRVWSLSIAIIVLSGVELILALLLTISLVANTNFILQNIESQNLAAKLSAIIEDMSIDVGSLEVSAQSSDGAAVGFTNVPNISIIVLKDAGIINDSGQVIGTPLQKVTVALLSISITTGVLAIFFAFFTFLVGFIIHLKSQKPQKYGSVVGWSIVSAILCLVVARWVSMVLFIIIAVSAAKNTAKPTPGAPGVPGGASRATSKAGTTGTPALDAAQA